MSQGAINIDHSRPPLAPPRKRSFSFSPRRRKGARAENGRDEGQDFRNFLRYNRAREADSARANCVFSSLLAGRSSRSPRRESQNTIRYDLTSAGGRGGGEDASGRKSLICTANGVIRTRPGAIFSLPTRGYNVFLGTLINSIHFAQRFLITHCTEP